MRAHSEINVSVTSYLNAQNIMLAEHIAMLLLQYIIIIIIIIAWQRYNVKESCRTISPDVLNNDLTYVYYRAKAQCPITDNCNTMQFIL